MSDIGVCDVCGQPATSLARDVKRTEPPKARWAEYAYTGTLKRGCDQHPARAHIFLHDGETPDSDAEYGTVMARTSARLREDS